MQAGLSAKLRKGRPRINADLSVSVLAEDGSEIYLIPPEAFVGGGTGYLYERLVCLDYERRGYVVEERSSLGYRDRGVDLIANRAGERVFVQCKFSLKHIGPTKVERLLYAASSFVQQNLIDGSNYFDLVVPSVELAFPRKGKKAALNLAHQRFLAYNRRQHRIVLRVVAVPIDLPDAFVLADQAEAEA